MKIAISGPMCSGKSTIAQLIKKFNNEYEIYSFGSKIKNIAYELFGMKEKNRSLLINIANKMKDIDKDVWAKHILRKTKNNNNCIIDDLRFQNELNHLEGWKIICLTTSTDERIKRLKQLYPENYQDHISNMGHLSETDTLQLPEDTIYLDTAIPMDELKRKVGAFITYPLFNQ